MTHRIILGIETSCDETAVGLIIDGRIVADRTTRQVLHELYGGVVPELASRAHEKLLVGAVEGVLRDAGINVEAIDAVAVTNGPGLAGALLVGVAFAKGLAAAGNIPLYGVNHVEGHLWSAEITKGSLPRPFLIGVKEYGDYIQLGSTRDDAVGELFDKVGRMLGFQFPAGAAIDKAALEYSGKPLLLPRARIKGEPLSFSFSGLKTAVLYHLRNNFSLKDDHYLVSEEQLGAICSGLMSAVSDMLLTSLEAAWAEGDYRALVVAGGVAASRYLRNKLGEFARVHDVSLYIPPLEHCTDNGSMIAYAGYMRIRAGHNPSPLDMSINPTANIFSSLN
jgi:N6-L-threonylcarbamoyladenine synthase